MKTQMLLLKYQQKNQKVSATHLIPVFIVLITKYKFWGEWGEVNCLKPHEMPAYNYL